MSGLFSSYRRGDISIGAFIDAMRSLGRGSFHGCTGTHRNTRSADAYRQWARDAFAQNDDRGYDGAVTYAKRAVCRRVDAMLVDLHIWRELRTYPEKLSCLEQLGLPGHEVVHELAID